MPDAVKLTSTGTIASIDDKFIKPRKPTPVILGSNFANINRELLDFRKGISKRVANETIRHFKKVIPSIRKHTKSDIQKAKDIKREISIPPKQVGISTKGVEVERRTEIKSTKGY